MDVKIGRLLIFPFINDSILTLEVASQENTFYCGEEVIPLSSVLDMSELSLCKSDSFDESISQQCW